MAGESMSDRLARTLREAANQFAGPTSADPTPMSPPTVGPQSALPGMNPGPVFMPSADPNLAGSTANGYAQQNAQDLKNHQREYMMVMGDFTKQMKRNVSELAALADQVAQARGAQASGSGSRRPTRPSTGLFSANPLPDETISKPGPSSARSNASQGFSEGGFGGAGSPTTPGRAPSGLPSGSDSGPISARPSVDGPAALGYSEGRATGSSMGSIAQRVAQYAARSTSQRINEWDNSPSLGENGKFGFHERDSDGNILQTVEVNPNGSAEDFEAAANRVSDLDRGNNRLRYATGALSRYGAGEGIAGAIGGTVAKVAGPVGIAVGAFTSAESIMASQTAAAAPYRQAYGASAGRFAISQRAGEFEAGLSSYLQGYGSGIGKEAYQGAARLGLTGSQQDQAVNFAQSMYGQYGMSSDQSMSFVAMSANNAEVSLSKLADQIKAVSDSAVAAGVSSQSAIQNFQAMAEGFQMNVSNTEGSVTTAANISTVVNNNLPKELITSPDGSTSPAGAALSSLLNDNGASLYASITGQSGAAVRSAMRSGDTNIQQSIVGADLEYICDSITRSGTGMDSQTFVQTLSKQDPRWAASFASNKWGSEEYGSILQAYPNLSDAISAGFSGYGVNISGGDEIQLYFRTIGGQFSSLANAQINAAGAAPGSSATGSSDLVPFNNPLDPGKKATDKFGSYTQGVDYASQIESNATGQLVAPGTLGQKDSQVYSSYAGFIEKSGQTSKVLDELLGSKSLAQAAGVSNMGDVKFVMPDGSTMSFHDLLNAANDQGNYSDPSNPYYQLVHGQLQAESSDNKTLLTLSQYAPDLGSPTSGQAGATPGEQSTPQGLTLHLSPYAKRLFRLTGPSESQASGTPAAGTVDPSTYGN